MLHYYLLQNLRPLENLLSLVFSSSKDVFFTGHMNFQEVSITLQLFIVTFSFFLHFMDKYLMRHSAHSFLRFRRSVQHHSVSDLLLSGSWHLKLCSGILGLALHFCNTFLMRRASLKEGFRARASMADISLKEICATEKNMYKGSRKSLHGS